MSKAVKQLILSEYKKRFTGVEGAVLVELRGVPGIDNNRMRVDLRKQSVRVTVVTNSLAKRAFEKTPLEALVPGLTGPTAVVYGGESVVNVARELVRWAKELEKLTLKGACIDGEWFGGKEGVERLAKFPTREEAQAKVVTLVLSPARKAVAAIKGPGGRLLGVIKSVQERLEKGEAIAPVA